MCTEKQDPIFPPPYPPPTEKGGVDNIEQSVGDQDPEEEPIIPPPYPPPTEG